MVADGLLRVKCGCGDGSYSVVWSCGGWLNGVLEGPFVVPCTASATEWPSRPSFHYIVEGWNHQMKLSGLAAFLLYDTLQRGQVTDGRAFCLRQHGKGHHLDVDLNQDGGAKSGARRAGDAGYHLELDFPLNEDLLAAFRDHTVLAVDKDLAEQLGSARVDARLEGNTVTLMLCTDIGCWTFSQGGDQDMER